MSTTPSTPSARETQVASAEPVGTAGEPKAVPEATTQLEAALCDGESIAAVSFLDRPEPVAGWVLTTASGHAFRIRPTAFWRPQEPHWEAGHDADGAYWWASNIDDLSLTKVLARIRTDSATRTRFAALWAKYGQHTAQAPAFGCTPDRVELEPGVFLIRRFGAVGLIAECRWGFEHLTSADGHEGHTGEDWARRGPDHRRYVAEWMVWNYALSKLPSSRLRVISVCPGEDRAADADAFCAMSAPYVGKCSAKRSGDRYWVAVVDDQVGELGRFVACARCLSRRMLDEAHGGDRSTGQDVVGLAEALAKGDPKTCTLHWKQWGDRAAEVCGRLLTEALESGERGPWPSKALAEALIAQGADDGDDRARREARAAVRAQGGSKKEQDEAARTVTESRADRTALVASVRASRAALSARLNASIAASAAEKADESGPFPAAGTSARRATYVPEPDSTKQSLCAAAPTGRADSPVSGGGAIGEAVSTAPETADTGVENSTDRWLDEREARAELPRMGWCTGLADVLAAAYAGDLRADTSGIVRRREGQGRRVRAALVELLASGGYIAVPRSGRRGPVTVTVDGVTAHRWCSAAPDLLHVDQRAAYWARVGVHHTGRTSKQTARDRARTLAPLPYGAEDKRRRAAQMRQVEQWAKEIQATRERLAAEQAKDDAQADQERAAEWARINRESEERRGAQDDRRDDGLVMSEHGPQEIVMGTDRRRVTVTRVSPSVWEAVVRGAVYSVSKEGDGDWPWLVIAPEGTRIGVCSLFNDAPYAASVRDIVRAHADAMEAQASAEAEQAAKKRATALRAAEEKATSERAATPTGDELAVLEALNTDGLDAEAAATLSSAYIGHVVTRHRPGATSARLDAGTGKGDRRVTRTYNVNGVEKPITPAAADALAAAAANLTDATAETWHALCTAVNERYGVYQLDLAAAIKAGTATLALLDQAEQGPEEPAELWASREFVQTAKPGTEAEVIEWAGAGLLWQNGDGFRHAGRKVNVSRVLPLVEAGTLHRSADGRVYSTQPSQHDDAAVPSAAGHFGPAADGSGGAPQAQEPGPVRVPDTFAASGRTPLTYDDLDGWTYADFVAAHPSEEDTADLVRLAGPGPVRWLFAPAEGDAPRAVNLFGGCGGWCVGIRRILGITVDMLCIDVSRDATATATRAGCHAVCADVRSIDPEHPVFRYTQILIGSSPCIDFTNAGKRAGRLPENVAVLADAIEQAGAAVGNYVQETDCTGPSDDECACEQSANDHFGPRSGDTWAEIRALVADLPGATTAGLMLEPMIWALALQSSGAPLHTILFEQSNQLPEEIREVITDELYCAGERDCLGGAASVTWEEIDAAAYGSPSTRKRAFLMATFGRFSTGPVAPEITITADEATGLPADLEVITRGARKTSGGNAFVMGRVIPGVTSRIRSVDVGHKGGRFTLEQIAALVTLPREYAALAAGSRTSVCQQFADIVAPVVSAAVFSETVGHLFGIKKGRGGWLPLLLAYLRKQYPQALAFSEAVSATVEAGDDP